MVGRELEVLVVLLRAVVAAREREDHRVVALDLAEGARDPVVVGQLVVGERGAGDDVGAHPDPPWSGSAQCRADPRGSRPCEPRSTRVRTRDPTGASGCTGGDAGG